MSPPSFSENFWGANDPGFNILIERLRRSKHSNEEILEIFVSRAAIEEEYGKKLQKLSKGITAKEESGTLKKCVETIREELERSSNIHLKVSTDIKTLLEKPLSGLITEHSNRKKQQVKEMERSLKTKRAQISLVDKTKKNYESKVKEADAAADAVNKSNGPQKELDKLSVKSKKAVAAVEVADKEYKSSIEKLDQITDQWEKDHRTMCEEFERIELERSEKLKEILNSFTDILSSSTQEEDSVVSKIREGVSHVNPEADITDFVREFASGSTPPEHLIYENISNHLIPVPGSDSGTLKRPLQGQSSTLSLGEKDDVPSSSPPSNPALLPPASQNKCLFYVKVLYDYEPQGEEELDLQEGETLGVVSIEEDPWWEGEKKGKRAMFPSNFVQKL